MYMVQGGWGGSGPKVKYDRCKEVRQALKRNGYTQCKIQIKSTDCQVLACFMSQSHYFIFGK